MGRSKLTGARATSDSSQREILEYLIPISNRTNGNPKGLHNSYKNQKSETKSVNFVLELTKDCCDQGIVIQNKYRN